MLDRYSTLGMRTLLSEEMRFGRLLAAACIASGLTDHEEGLGGRLHEAVRRVTDRMFADLPDWLRAARELELVLDHDIAAVVESIRAELSPDLARYFHLGRTSSDLVETALALEMRAASAMLLAAEQRFLRALANVALEHQTSPVRGRTHGQPAEMTTVGRRFAVIAAAAHQVTESVASYDYGKLTGPVGIGSPEAASNALALLGLGHPASTQIVPRQYLSAFVSGLSLRTVAVSEVAMLIRLGARDGVGQWCAEGRSATSRGSSSMPTKRNPIRSERACGLARLVRSNCASMIETWADLWEERDISNSAVERTALPDALALTEFLLHDVAAVLENLDVWPGRIETTPAASLRQAVRDGVDYNTAYGAIRDGGSTVRPKPYRPSSEPELWALMRQIAG